jgi:enoyl-CoA hydratase
MTDSHIQRERRDRALILTLNRPDKLNALTWGMVDELLAAADAGAADREVAAIVIRGAGRCFCSGFDIGGVVETDPAAQSAAPHADTALMQRAAGNWRRLWNARKPVIVAVHGYCLGAALELVVHADLVVASEDATFGYPAVRGSGLPDSHMFVYHIGPQWTKRLLLSGDSIDAATAAHIGLILKTVPREKLDQEALALVDAVSQVPGPLLEAGKNVINHAIELMGYTALQRQNWNEMAMARATPEVSEFSRIAREQGMKAAMAWRDTRK